MLNIAIVDDEESVRKELGSYIDRYFSEKDCEVEDEYVVDSYSDGASFLSAQFNSFDIVFMDIKMPMRNGLDVAREFRKSNQTACLLFVTNLAEMAIKGYEVSALDFIVKPLTYEDFRYSMSKAVRRALASGTGDNIMVRNNRALVKIPVQSILYAETDYHKIIYHTITGDVEEWCAMREAEKRLRRYFFSRCNSGFLVNLRYIDKVSDGCAYIGKTVIPISRNRRTEFMNDMMNYMGGNKLDG